MKYRFLSLAFPLVLLAGTLYAEPVDLLQQLYGRAGGKSASSSPAQRSGGGDASKAALPRPEALPGSASILTLNLRSSISIARERLYLSDLVTCQGPKDVCSDIGGIDYGAAPKANRQDRSTRSQIEALVQKETAQAQVKWEGAQACLISALSSPIDEEAVLHLLEREFQSAPSGMRVIVQSVRLPTTQVLRHNNYLYKIPSFADQITRIYANPRSRFGQIKLVAVDQDPSSQASIEFLVQLNFRIEIQALVMTQARERGERVTPELVELQWIPYQDQVLTDDKLIVGKLLRVRLQAKQAIRTWDLIREPEVLRGDRIEAVINSGGIRMNSVAQALEPGFIGQKIRIRLEATKKNVLGVVIARSQVEVPSL